VPKTKGCTHLNARFRIAVDGSAVNHNSGRWPKLKFLKFFWSSAKPKTSGSVFHPNPSREIRKPHKSVEGIVRDPPLSSGWIKYTCAADLARVGAGVRAAQSYATHRPRAALRVASLRDPALTHAPTRAKTTARARILSSLMRGGGPEGVNMA